jgi:hypothetical protein
VSATVIIGDRAFAIDGDQARAIVADTKAGREPLMLLACERCGTACYATPRLAAARGTPARLATTACACCRDTHALNLHVRAPLHEAMASLTTAA